MIHAFLKLNFKSLEHVQFSLMRENEREDTLKCCCTFNLHLWMYVFPLGYKTSSCVFNNCFIYQNEESRKLHFSEFYHPHCVWHPVDINKIYSINFIRMKKIRLPANFITFIIQHHHHHQQKQQHHHHHHPSIVSRNLKAFTSLCIT